mgnify:CR=1 FL=1
MLNYEKVFGGENSDIGTDIMLTSNYNSDGFIISASTKSLGQGLWDYWLIKTNSLGETSPY